MKKIIIAAALLSLAASASAHAHDVDYEFTLDFGGRHDIEFGHSTIAVTLPAIVAKADMTEGAINTRFQSSGSENGSCDVTFLRFNKENLNVTYHVTCNRS